MTVISHRYKFICLKTNKTASTSIEAMLEPLCLPDGAPTGEHNRSMEVSDAGIIGYRGPRAELHKHDWYNHMAARDVKRKIGDKIWNSYIRFAGIRNPYDRAVSKFWWDISEDRRRALTEAPFSDVRKAFETWIGFHNLRENHEQLFVNGRYCLTHVLYYEHLDKELSALFRLLGAPAPNAAPRYKSGIRNRSEGWRDYFTEKSKRILERKCGFELAFFGYDFEGGPYPQSNVTRAKRLAMLAPMRLADATKQAISPLESTSDPLDHSERPE